MFIMIQNVIVVQFSYTHVIKFTFHRGSCIIVKKKKIELYLDLGMVYNQAAFRCFEVEFSTRKNRV